MLAILSALSALAWWRGVVPFPFLGSDSGNIASFAAAWAHPQFFQGDMVLSDPANFRFYVNGLIPLLIALERLFGDFGTAFIALLGPTFLVQALGWYVLGRLLFADRWAAFLLALLSFGTVSLTVNYYGLYVNPEPRVIFQAVLPYLLAGMLRYGPNPASWPWLMAAHGLSVYVHPGSAPTVAFASWLGLWALCPPAWSFWTRAWRTAAAGAVFLAVAAPFLGVYLDNHEHGAVTDYARMIHILGTIYGTHYVDVVNYLQMFFSKWTVRYLLPAWAIAGVALLYLNRGLDRRRALFWVLWLSGVVLASVGTTWVEQTITRRLEMLPPEVDLVRNIRFVVPIAVLFGLWGLVSTRAWLGRRAWYGVSLCMVVLWLGFNRPGSVPFRATLACFKSGAVLCPRERWMDELAVLDALKALPKGTRVLPALDPGRGLDLSLAVRYYALKPAVFTFKDSAALGYANHRGLERWLSVKARMDGLLAMKNDGPAKTNRAFRIARELGAQVLIADFPLNSAPKDGAVLVRSGPLSLARVPSARPGDGQE